MGHCQRPGEFGRLSAVGECGVWDTHCLIIPTMAEYSQLWATRGPKKNGSEHRGLSAPSSGTTAMGAPS